jgi:very-short-patch-repair endonuclease
LGFLKWFESDSSEIERFAPLILLPVSLERQSARSRFTLRYREEEITTNLSLQAKLKFEFGLDLPELPDDEDLIPGNYFADVQQAVSGMRRWEVKPSAMVLGFFSFAKFLMYRDLDPANWPHDRPLASAGLVQPLLQDGFEGASSFDSEEHSIDSIIPVERMTHIRDADSSQMLAIEHVRRGGHLVIQGPPGTGKSQTIANLIAAAVKEGKKVLFVAEKMAALEVVQRRLDEVGLGPICLELHSHKAKKRAVLEELNRTLELGAPTGDRGSMLLEQLEAARAKLNSHAERIHAPIAPSGWTPYRILAELVRIRGAAVKSESFSLADCEQWSASEMRSRRDVLADAVDNSGTIGTPAQSPWHGVGVSTILPSDLERLSRRWTQMIERINHLTGSAHDLASSLSCQIEMTPRDIHKLATVCLHLSSAPEMDRRRLVDEVWQTDRDQISRIVEAGKNSFEAVSTLGDTVADVAWTTDLGPTRRHLTAYGRSWFRLLNRNYRDARATLIEILDGPPPKSLKERLAIVDLLIRGQKARAAVASGNEIGRRAFGTLWRQENSDWGRLSAIADWEAEACKQGLPKAFRLLLARMDNSDDLRNRAQSLAEEVQATGAELNEIFRAMNFDPVVGLGIPPVRDNADNLKKVPLSLLSSKLNEWLADPEALPRWIAFRTRWEKLRSNQMEELADRLYDGRLPFAESLEQFDLSYFEALMRAAYRCHPSLAEFSGKSHDRLVQEFRRLDRERIDLARREVALAHFGSLPKGGSSIGELGIVRGEIAKKRRHMAIRKLLSKAGRAVQAIKPVFMMSPLSVAQYLEPGTLRFDLLLIDEASQVRPVDALGATARVDQIVVVGDDKQLPPSRFFSSVLEETGDEEGDGLQIGDLQSVLGLCVAKNMPQRMLRWHYRSRHHSLIELSNREFYESKLFVVPSPGNTDGELGLFFRAVPHGRYDRGHSATNAIEAERVANAVLEHARSHPELSLGVAAFSVAQRDAIVDELELLRREHSDLEEFCARGSRAEPFFVKNLENVQGDERDVIFISVGYGPDETGRVTMNFGPLSAEGGERRLNVLITRARRRCEVFSSLTDEHIDLNRARGRGPQVLKAFLKYARTGELDGGADSRGNHESPFEETVADALRAQGLIVTPQLGVAGFFVDLAVSDPAKPGRYLLGVECDGASYHSSRSARDRDRLRQQVLEEQGWILHRIWSSDWFHRPDDERRKLMAAIEAARVKLDQQAKPAVPASKPEGFAIAGQIERDRLTATDTNPSNGLSSVAYEEASFAVDCSMAIHEMPLQRLMDIVVRIVRLEQPIHVDEVARRVTAFWGQARTGSRIRKAVRRVARAAAASRRLEITDDFCKVPGAILPAVRSRELVMSQTLRRPDMLPPEEIALAIKSVVKESFGAQPDEVFTAVARLLGFKSTSAQLRERFSAEANRLVKHGDLTDREGTLAEAEPVAPATIKLREG